jgi:aromatic ring-opening dioxygenase catalytic subunit (LigB family)
MSEATDDSGRLSRRDLLKGALAVGAVAGLAGCAREAAGSQVAPGPSAPPERAAQPTNREAPMSAQRMPVISLPHGGGPCFFMDWRMGPPDTWERTAAYLRGIKEGLPAAPKALLVVSAHWEEPAFTVTTRPTPQLLFDYYGFPRHTYELKWPAPHAPALAERVQTLLRAAGLPAAADPERGLDHGVFVPLKVAWPEAEVPTVQLSLRRGLDPAEHLAMGRALAPLRDEGVLIVGSGMSFHNMRAFGGGGAALAASEAFDGWLADSVTAAPAQRDERLAGWAAGPSARFCHPREEHLLPLMVVAGAAGADAGRVPFRDVVMGVRVSAHHFG